MAFFICQACGTEYEAAEPKCPACGRTETIRLNRTDRMIDRLISGRYKLVKKLGQGGMGAVYLAEQVGIGHRVAIKFLKTEFSNDVEIARRFLNEAKTYAKVSHPNAVTFHEFGQDDEGNLYIAMEYCDGVDLKKTIAERGRLSIVESVEVVTQVADVLADAHQKQIVHRDLKPENIMIRKGLRGMHAKVLDFGIARLMDASTKLTAVGAIAGTPRYMSPEQVNGQEVDARADIYALGIVCFEALTGRQPFDGNTIAEIMRKQVMEPLPRLAEVVPDLDLPPLQAVLDRACAKRRDERYADMIAFASALTAAIPTQMHHALPPMQRLATEASRSAVMATPAPGRGTGVAVPGTLVGNDANDRTMVREPSDPALATPAGTVTEHAAVTRQGATSIGSINPGGVGNVSLPPTVQKSKGPLIGVGLLVVALIAGAAWLAVGTGKPTGETKDPVVVVKPPDVPIEPVKVEPPPKPPDANPMERVIDELTAKNSLKTAKTSWDKGELENALIDLQPSVIPPTSQYRAEADQLEKDIKAVQESLALANAARARGECEVALKSYRAALKLNPNVPAVKSGLAACTAAAIPLTE